MTEGRRRRPLPALICLLALTLLTALVWWRVLHRSDAPVAAKPTCAAPTSAPALPKPATVALTVLNATTRHGIAKATAATLTTDGFKINSFSNDTAKVPGIAEIRFTPDEQGAATLLEYYFPGATQVPLTGSVDSRLVVSLGNAFQAVAAPAAVQAAIVATHGTPAPGATSTRPAPSTAC
ncbi:MAG: LytR C-terminal domain-containing protein [Actinomycetota bacterium]|nr:LytR C-terminal domain-containing protein [Actinomycetota bacterium]